MAGTNATILVVDSDPIHRESMALTLRTAGYRVLEARSYQDADNMRQSHLREIDLLVTAITLPERNGYQLAARMTSIEPGIKVLFVSGATGALLSRFYGRRPDDRATLHRPFEPDDLLQRVKSLVSRTHESGAAGA